MAKINLITGAARGSAGGYTYKKWNGTQVMSAKVAKGPRPFNPAQLLNQEKQGKLTKFLSFMYAGIILGFQKFTAGTSAWAQAIKENTGTVSGTLGATIVNYASIKVAKGNLDAPSGVLVEHDGSANSIGITMSSLSNGVTSHPSDELQIIVYNSSKNASLLVADVAARGTIAGNMLIEIPGAVAGDIIHVYSFFVAADSSSVSNSTYSTIVL